MPDKVVAIVQARMGSTRFPGKVTQLLGKRSVLDWVTRRLAHSTSLDQIVVATSKDPANAAIVEFCDRQDLACFCGEEEDVLGRFVGAAGAFDADWIVRVNADNPLISPQHVDELVLECRRRDLEYASFKLADGRPVMLASVSFFAEVLSRPCLERASATIRDRFEREHVTLGIYTRPQQFRVGFLDVPPFANDPRLRFTLDTPEDLGILRSIFDALGCRAEVATAEEIARLVGEQPELLGKMQEQNRGNPKAPSS